MKFLFLVSFLFLVGCSASALRDTAYQVSDRVDFIERKIQADPFLLTAREKVRLKGGVANIYIEGDGAAWLNRKRPSLDPTPKNPVGLKLATQDPADNVIYLARPCQYTKLVREGACPQKYWTSHRFAPEVVDAMDKVLSDIKQRHQITGFNLIGFSGGGNVAALLTARRNDVLSLRTVAGNLDHELQSKIHRVSLMPASLNAKRVAYQISHIPQIHFVGGKDKIVPHALYEAYESSSGNAKSCVRSSVVESAGHAKNWETLWPELLRKRPSCDE